MSLEGLEVFVQTAGAALGLARESFYLDFGIGEGGGVGLSSASGPSATLTAAFSGSGQAALAADNESNLVNGQGSPLSAQDLATSVHLDSTVAAAQAGRSEMDSVIAAALADVKSLAAQPVALVQALGGHLENAWQKLTNGQANASTCMARTLNHVAAYNGLGYSTGVGLASTSTAGVTSQAGGVSSIGTLSSTAMMAAMAGSAAATSAGRAASTQQASPTQQATLDADVTPIGAQVSPISTPTAVSNIQQVSINTGPAGVSGYISQALQLMGITPSSPNNAYNNWMTGLLDGASHESAYGALPINDNDSNAVGKPAADGYPSGCSRGILQMVPGTFGAYHQTGTSYNVYDPIANITAAMNYLMQPLSQGGKYGVKPDGSNLATAVSDGDFSSNYQGGGY